MAKQETDAERAAGTLSDMLLREGIDASVGVGVDSLVVHLHSRKRDGKRIPKLWAFYQVEWIFVGKIKPAGAGLKAKRKYRISSGTMKRVVEASTARRAAILAVQSTRARSLGMLIEITGPEGVPQYIDTEMICREAGVFSGWSGLENF